MHEANKHVHKSRAAAARVMKGNINIHISGQQPIVIGAGSEGAVDELLTTYHISYHGGVHYNSVRELGDMPNNPMKLQMFTNDNDRQRR